MRVPGFIAKTGPLHFFVSFRVAAARNEEDMKLVKAMAIVFFLAIVAALVVANANAQSPSASSTTGVPVGSIPEKIPPNWAANGSDQASWTALREHCRAVFAKPNKFYHSEWEGCVHLSSAFSALPGPSMTPSLPPLAAAPGSPTPLPTPVPPSSPQSSADELVSPASSLALVTGPFGTPFSGGYEDACSPILG